MKRTIISSKHLWHITVQGLVLVSLLLANPSWADSKKHKIVTPVAEPSKPLILSPSDAWANQLLVKSTNSHQELLNDNAGNSNNINKPQNKKIDLGCDLDLGPQAADKDRLSNRLVGECRLGYNY